MRRQAAEPAAATSAANVTGTDRPGGGSAIGSWTRGTDMPAEVPGAGAPVRLSRAPATAVRGRTDVLATHAVVAVARLCAAAAVAAVAKRATARKSGWSGGGWKGAERLARCQGLRMMHPSTGAYLFLSRPYALQALVCLLLSRIRTFVARIS